MKKITSIAILATSILGAGCSTIMTGKEQQISINSNVKGATILLNGAEIGKTPFVGKVTKPKSGEGNTLTLRAPGYDDKTIAVETNIEPTFFVNVLSGGPFGSTTDYSSGSMYKMGDGNFNVDLEKSAGK